jgi:iron(III) transport system ATP-binding protein
LAQLIIDRVAKLFAGFRAVDGVSIDVRDGEFLAVLGPSGCGKTTLLRLIAGFEPVDEGEIRIGERLMSAPGLRVAPEDRRVGIVFQTYALWPHMTVAGNVGFALRVAGLREPERAARVAAALDERRPASLSGGQRQRVALARCLAAEPTLVLLDEPLANLDAHLRAAMEEEFARLHRRAGATMIYITHDQAEAMALADRIAVMDRGRLLQLGSPAQLYREPANETVGRFIGQGFVLPIAAVEPLGGGRARARLYGEPVTVRAAPGQAAVAAAALCLRPRDLRLAGEGEAGLPATFETLVYQGGRYRGAARPDADPAALLRVEIDEPAIFPPDRRVRLAVRDGWILPDGAPGVGAGPSPAAD